MILNETDRDSLQQDITLFITTFSAEVQEMRRCEAIATLERGRGNSSITAHRAEISSYLIDVS